MKKNNLKLISLVLLVLCRFIAQAQELSLHGQVSIHNSQYETGTIEYVQNAYVNAEFAIPTKTDVAGKFGLVFQSITKGDKVELAVEKEEYEVVNKRVLQDVVLGRTMPLKIYLAPKDRLAQAQTELYGISLSAITAKHDTWIAELRKGGEESKAIIQQLEQQLGREIAHRFEAEEILNEKLEATKKRLPEVVKQLAMVNLDFASETYRQAYEFYKAGEIEKAISVLDEAQLSEQISNVLAGLEQANESKAAYQVALEQVEEQVDQIVQAYTLKSEAYSLIFDYRAALNVYKKAVELLEQMKEEEDLELGNSFDALGGLYQNLGEYKSAFVYIKKSLDVSEELLSPDDQSIATSYNNLASIYQDLGDYKEALVSQEKTIALQEKFLPNNHPFIAQSYNNLAVIYQDLGEYGKALKAYQKAIVLKKQMQTPDYLSISISYNNLASVYKIMGAYEDAFQTQEKALDIQIKYLENNDPNVAYTYNNLALIYKDLGAYEKALETLLQAVSIYKQIFEPNHPNLATAYNNLALLYRYLGKYEEALRNVQKAITIGEIIWKDSHPNIASSYNNLASIYQALNRYEEALQAQLKALGIQNRTIDPDHSLIATSYNNLGLIYKDLGQYEKAFQSIKKGINIGEQILEPNQVNIAASYNNLALVYQAKKEYEKALEIQNKSLGIQLQELESDHASIASTYHNMVYTFFYLNQLDSALYYEQKAYSIWRLKLTNSHPTLRTAKNNISVLYTRIARSEQSKARYQIAIDKFLHALVYTQDSASIYNQIGSCYYSLNNFDKSIEYYDLSHQLKSINESVYLSNSGLAYAKMYNFNEAQNCFEQLQELTPNDTLVYINWAIYYALQEDKENAITNLEKAIKLGFNDLTKITNEEVFQIFHEEPRYQAIIRKLQNKK